MSRAAQAVAAAVKDLGGKKPSRGGKVNKDEKKAATWPDTASDGAQADSADKVAPEQSSGTESGEAPIRGAETEGAEIDMAKKSTGKKKGATKKTSTKKAAASKPKGEKSPRKRVAPSGDIVGVKASGLTYLELTFSEGGTMTLTPTSNREANRDTAVKAIRALIK